MSNVKEWFRIAPETPPSTAAGIAPRNVSRMTQGVIILICLGFMALWVYVLTPQGMEWMKAAEDVCEGITRLRILLLPMLLVPYALLVFVALDGLRSLQHGRWPWPGMWLWKDTPIRSKTYALWRGRLMLAIGLPVLLALTAYMSWTVLFGELLKPEVHAECAALQNQSPTPTPKSPILDSMKNKTLGIIGARGHTGAELIRLVAAHPQLELAFVSSRELDGQRVADHNPAYSGELRYENLDAAATGAHRADAIVLALPNGKSADFVAAIEANAPDTVVVDLSADYRFDEAWYYGLPELTRQQYAGQRRIANPGCYATAMQLAIAPFKADLAAPVQCFGVSGYSGAGTTPSDKNNPDLLRDNLMPYALTGHLHEREVSRHTAAVEFMPHVAPHFRGLAITANLHLKKALTAEAALQRAREFYAAEPLVAIGADAPWVSRVAGRHHAMLGGFAVDADGKRLVLVSVLDNLLKGAATQAMQNLNLAFGFDELAGIFPTTHEAGL